MDNDYWKSFSYVMRAKQRKIIIKVMNGPDSVTEIKKKTQLSLAETSRILSGLVKNELAECKNPENKHKMYCLTELCIKIKKELKN